MLKISSCVERMNQTVLWKAEIHIAVREAPRPGKAGGNGLRNPGWLSHRGPHTESGLWQGLNTWKYFWNTRAENENTSHAVKDQIRPCWLRSRSHILTSSPMQVKTCLAWKWLRLEQVHLSHCCPKHIPQFSNLSVMRSKKHYIFFSLCFVCFCYFLFWPRVHLQSTFPKGLK